MAMKRDEEWINALYREYRGTRDGIPWDRYQPILEAARDMTFQAAAERHMSAIMQRAREMYPEQQAGKAEAAGEDRVIDWSSASRRVRRRGAGGGMGARLRDSARSLVSSINPAGWVPLAAAAAIVLAVAPIMMDIGGSGDGAELVAEQTELLRGNPAAVSAEIGRLGEMQYGFASSGSDFSRAFRAGILFVDLVSLSGIPEDPQVAGVVREVVDGFGEIAAIGQPERIDTASLNQIVDSLQAHYSDSGQSAVFVFGQWVESTYLLARLATAGDTSALSEAIEGGRAVRDLLETGGQLDSAIETDLATLLELGAAGDLDAGTLERISLMLLKLRTRYALS
jgi:hypothetical protein